MNGDSFLWVLFGVFGGMAIGGQIGKLLHMATGSFAVGAIGCAACIVAGGYTAWSLRP